MAPAVRERIYWIDGLKALIVVGIALFHVCLVFTPGTWVVNNAERSLILGGFAGFTFQWGIALMFLLAGAATWFGLRSRPARRYASGRVVRLGVPLALGIAILSPLQNYFEYNHSFGAGALLRNYWTFWGSVRITWSPASAYGALYHLWFLADLLLISLVTLPIALWLRSAAGTRLAGRLVLVAAHPGGLLLLGALPLAAVQMALHARFPSYQDWSDVAAWTVLYISGFIFISDHRFTEIVLQRGRELVMAAAIAALMGGLLFASGLIPAWDSNPTYSTGYFAYQALRSINTWIWVMFFVYLGARWLNRDTLLTSWGAEMPMPFYVLSHPVIVVLAAYVTGWNMGLWPKFVALTVLSITLGVLLCEGVRRSRVLRVVFGLSAGAKVRGGRGSWSTRKAGLRPL